MSDLKYSDLGIDQRNKWADKVLSLTAEIDNNYGLSIKDPIRKLRNLPKGKFLEKISKTFHMHSVEDLIYHFPDRHDDFTDLRNIRDLQIGMTQTIKAKVLNVSIQGINKSKQRVQIKNV